MQLVHRILVAFLLASVSFHFIFFLSISSPLSPAKPNREFETDVQPILQSAATTATTTQATTTYTTTSPPTSPPSSTVPPKLNLVVVRTHQTTPAKVDRWIEWAESIYRNDTSIQFWISIDQTDTDIINTEIIKHAIELKQLPPHLVQLHEYNQGSVDQLYQSHLQAGRPWWYKPLYLFHVEPLLAFVRHVASIATFYEGGIGHVWVLEDDLGYTGDLGTVLKSYDQRFPAADLITKEYSHQSDDWPCFDWSTVQFRQKYSREQMWWSPEFVQRISGKLLLEVDRLMREEMITAMSELFITTVCRNGAFDCQVLDRQHYDEDKFFFKYRANEQEWMSIKQDPANKDKFVHGLKF